MFEFIASSFINKLVGKYVESITATQFKKLILLNFSLESDIVFKNLILKPRVLDDILRLLHVRVPVTAAYCRIGEIVLKIPWGKLTSAPICIHVRDISLLIVPAELDGTNEDGEREAKKLKLARIEAAKMREAERSQLQKSKGSHFLSNLIDKIMNYLQVTIENVHIRYEDDTSDPSCPFAGGITLEKLAMESDADAFSDVSEPSGQYFKLVSLENLSCYWLVQTQMFHRSSKEEVLELFSNGIVTADRNPYGNSFIVSPLSLQVKLAINPKPEFDGSKFTAPKIGARVKMKKLTVSLTPQQFAAILLLYETILRKRNGAPYRKYRPNVAYRSHGREWWKFAYTCVLYRVQCRRKQWQWDSIKQHLTNVKKYINLYAFKLTETNVDSKTAKKLEELENKLDIFNITQARSRAEMKVLRNEMNTGKREFVRQKSFLGGLRDAMLGENAEYSEDPANPAPTLLTNEERAQLFEAIDCEEDDSPAYPRDFVNCKLQFEFEKVTFMLKSNAEDFILRAELPNLKGTVIQRSVARSFELTLQIGNFHLDGPSTVKECARLIESLDVTKNMLSLTCKLNPIEDSSIKMLAKLDMSTWGLHLQREILMEIIQRAMNDFISNYIKVLEWNQPIVPTPNSKYADRTLVTSSTSDGEITGLQVNVHLDGVKVKLGTLKELLAEINVHDLSTGVKMINDSNDVTFHVKGLAMMLYPKLMELVDLFKIANEQKVMISRIHSSPAIQTRQTTKRHMSLSAAIDEVDVFLLEQSDVSDTNALVVNMSSKVVLQNSEHMELTATIPKLRGYCCVFDPARREETTVEILSPFSATITCNQLNNGTSALNVGITAKNIPLRLSPETCTLCLNILNNAKASQSQVQVEEKSIEKMSLYPDLWKVKPVQEMNFPFLQGSESDEITTVEESDDPQTEFQLKIAIEGITVLLETRMNNTKLPLVLIESSLNFKFARLLTGLDMEASLLLQATYYNRTVSLWEPLIEPVFEVKDGIEVPRPWKLTFNYQQLKEARSAAQIIIESADTLELTVTKGFFHVIETISEEFGGTSKYQVSKSEAFVDIYTVRNDLDVNVILDLAASELVLSHRSNEQGPHVILKPTTEVCLKAPIKSEMRSILQEQETKAQRKFLRVAFNDLQGQSYQIPLIRRNRRHLSFRQKDGRTLGAVVEVCTDLDFNQRVTFRSLLKINNCFAHPIDVIYYDGGKQLTKIGRLNENQTFNVPPSTLIKDDGELLFVPLGCLVSDKSISWKNIQDKNETSEMFYCRPMSVKNDQFYLQVTTNIDESIWSDGPSSIINPCYEVYLRPTVVLNNLLPIPLIVAVSDSVTENIISPGGRHQMTSVQLGDNIILKIANYLGREWTCQERLHFVKRDMFVWEFESGNECLNLGIYTKIVDHTLDVSVFCPFWMINKTGKTLSYKIEDDLVTCHPPTMEMPVLFRLPAKAIVTGKKKAQVQLEGFDWSEKFSVDVAGNSLRVCCKSSGGDVTHLGVHIQLGGSGLTKLITFSPSFVVSNLAPFDIQLVDLGQDLFANTSLEWTDVRSRDMVPIWPRHKETTIVLRVTSSPEQPTLPLSLNKQLPTLLRLDNRFGGIFVDFQVSKFNVCIICRPYEDGRAPVLLVNRSLERIKLSESHISTSKFELEPLHAAYYTWQHPNEARTLFCSGREETEVEVNILSDGNGLMAKSDSEKTVGLKEFNTADIVQWVSFLFGHQRVLLFTKDPRLVKKLQKRNIQEPVLQNFSLSMHGVGLSLVDNINRREILYTSISSSGIIWETGKHGSTKLQFRRVSEQDNALLEDAYQKYLAGKMDNLHLNPLQDLDGGRIRVDFQNWKISKPNDRFLRRSYHPGLELLVEISAHRRKLYASLQRFQVDNQLDDCIFPVAFAPVPPPPSITDKSIPMPFIQCFIVETHSDKKEDDMQIQDFHVRVQECYLCIDKHLADALMKLLASSSEIECAAKLQKAVQSDIDFTKKDLRQKIQIFYGKAAEHYFGQLSLSPLIIHVSTSWDSDGSDGLDLNTMIGAVSDMFIKGLTGLQDAVFNLEAFEKTNAFLSWNQLTNELRRHYVGQAMRNFYVLVLGLDALGNPIGLAKGITRGVGQLISEPIKGAMQGHDEFVEGLTLGARNMFGYTVGGMAGAASKITGTVGDNLAILTFDEDYKKQRRQMFLQPGNLKENLIQASKDMLFGIGSGISGVVTTPIKGAKEGGFTGCCHGAFRGIVGLFTKPAAATFDCANRSMKAIIQSADPNKTVTRNRPPRFLHPDGVVRPYQRQQADGDYLLNSLEGGYYGKTDIYVNHAEVGEHGRKVLMVTNHRVIFMHRNRCGNWKTKSSYTWAELADVPQIHPDGLSFSIPKSKKIIRCLPKHNRGPSERVIVINSRNKAVAIKEFADEMISRQKELSYTLP